jgi:hypothetical protein
VTETETIVGHKTDTGQTVETDHKTDTGQTVETDLKTETTHKIETDNTNLLLAIKGQATTAGQTLSTADSPDNSQNLLTEILAQTTRQTDPVVQLTDLNPNPAIRPLMSVATILKWSKVKTAAHPMIL